MEILKQYLSGDGAVEVSAVQALRNVGEAAARRVGLRSFDADAVGVDFAAFVLTGGGAAQLQRCYNMEAYVWRAACWFAAKQLRSLGWNKAVSADSVTPVASESGQDIVSMLAQRLMRQRVEAYVGRLPLADQRVYELCLLNELNCAEAATQIGCSPAAVRKRLERLRGRLRRVVDPQ